MVTYTGPLVDPNSPQLSPGDRIVDGGQCWTLLGVHSGAGWARQWVPGEFPPDQVILDEESSGQNELSSPDPPPDHDRRLTVSLLGGALVVVLGIGLATGRGGLIWLLVLAACGFLFGGFIAGVKLLRDAKAPMWTFRRKDGRKVHGFVNWWGTVFGLWVVAEFLLYDTYRLAGLIRYWWDLIDIWFHS